jgi:hypothetical protein
MIYFPQISTMRNDGFSASMGHSSPYGANLGGGNATPARSHAIGVTGSASPSVWERGLAALVARFLLPNSHCPPGGGNSYACPQALL